MSLFSKDLFSETDRQKIVEAIIEAEQNTSGEIRLFIEDKCEGDVLDRAAFIFKQLHIHETKERNGVLFYLATVSHKFAILGDAGINALVPKDFWDHIKDEMQLHFKAGDFVGGLIKGISMSDDALKKYFPYDKNDKNELSNEIIFGKD